MFQVLHLETNKIQRIFLAEGVAMLSHDEKDKLSWYDIDIA